MYASIVVLLAIFSLTNGMLEGIPAEEDSFPFQASIRRLSNSYVCGGAILSAHTVLTAAHCIRGLVPSNVFVHVGGVLLSEQGRGVHAPSKFVVHPSYRPWTMENDVGLVHLRDALYFDSFVQPVALQDSFVGEGVLLVFSGWGSNESNSVSQDRLHYTTLTTVGQWECRERLSSVNPITDDQICTRTDEHEGACHGDAGNPLTLSGKVVGVLSWIIPCALGFPDVFTRIDSYADWIHQNTQT